ncbi:MAG: hypothetical protein KJ587_14760 [Alphaproteobacteria bacterium]|nr:hypothetical protein [Alphaproteobacteria bacterium]
MAVLDPLPSFVCNVLIGRSSAFAVVDLLASVGQQYIGYLPLRGKKGRQFPDQERKPPSNSAAIQRFAD